MTLNRRAFFGALATAAVGACVAVKLPTSFLPTVVRRYAACDYLTHKFNEASRGGVRNCPKGILVGRELFDAYEQDIAAIQASRDEPVWCDQEWPDALMFKAASLTYYDLAGLHNWDVLMLNTEQWARAKEAMRQRQPLAWATNSA